MTAPVPVTLTVNGEPLAALVAPRTTLADLLRDTAGLTGTHLSCQQGWCGACTVLLDGASARSCLTLAVGAQDADVVTVEGVARDRLQQAFVDHFGLQCGYCTPGMIVLGAEILDEAAAGATFDRAEIARRVSANVCRCTGYVGIVSAIEAAIEAAPEEAR